MRSPPARAAKYGCPAASSASRSPARARSTSSGTARPVEPSVATSRQNDLRRMSNEYAADLFLINESSTRTVTSGSTRQSVRTRSRMSSGSSTGSLSWPTGGLPAERGPGRRGRGGEVVTGPDETPLAELHSLGDGPPVAEADEVERPDVHHLFEPAEFVVGRLDVPAVGIDGRVDPLLVGLPGVPRTRAPDQVGQVGQPRPAPRGLPVDRDRTLSAQDGVIGGVEEISVQQPFGKPVTVIGLEHRVPQPLEPLALGRPDLGIHGVEERQGG